MTSNTTGSPAQKALSVREFCSSYRLSRSTTYNLIRKGKLKSAKILGKRLILADSAENLLRVEGEI